MAVRRITEIILDTTEEKTGLLRKKTTREETLRLNTQGGSIILPESAVRGTGENWRLLKSRLYHSAKEKNIPFRDQRKKTE